MDDKTIDKTRRKARRVQAGTRVMMRMPAETRALIDSAAESKGKTRTEFVLDAARENAIKSLLETLLFRLDGEQWTKVDAIFAEPPTPTAELTALLAKRAPWE